MTIKHYGLVLAGMLTAAGSSTNSLSSPFALGPALSLPLPLC